MAGVLVGEAGEGEEELAEVGVVVGEVAELAVVELVVGAAAQLAAKQHMVAVIEAPPAVERLTSEKKMQQLAEEVAYYL